MREPTPEMLDRLPMDAFNSCREKLMQLEAALLADDPRMPQHLGAIQRELLQYPDMPHLLTDADLGLIVKGSLKFHKIHINVGKDPATGKTVSKSKLKLSADDLEL